MTYEILKKVLEGEEGIIPPKEVKGQKSFNSNAQLGLSNSSFIVLLGDYEFRKIGQKPNQVKPGLFIVTPFRGIALINAKNGFLITSASGNNHTYKVSKNNGSILIIYQNKKTQRIKEIMIEKTYPISLLSKINSTMNDILQFITPQSYEGLFIGVHPNDHGHYHIINKERRLITKTDENLKPIKGYPPLTKKQERGLIKIKEKPENTGKINREYSKQSPK